MKKLLAILLLCVGVTGYCQDCSDYLSQDGFELIYFGEESSFWLSDATTDWLSARSICQGLGGDLASFSSVEESITVGQLLGTHTLIGLFQDTTSQSFSEPSGGWTWTNGEPLTWDLWQFTEQGSEPNNVNGEEDVAELFDGYYNDLPHDYANYPFLLEVHHGCMDSTACNYDPLALCDNGTCASCEQLQTACLEGTVWSEELGGCVVANVSDTDFDGCVGINDFLVHLSNFGSGCGPEPAWACGDPLEYQGYDYETVQIGEQCWFAENLRAENYRNGDPIPSGLSDGDEWAGTTEGAVDVDEGDYVSTYGRLYNGYTAADERRLCPNAWSVPTDEDWMELEMALGMSESEANSTGWRGTDQGLQMKTTYGWIDDANGNNVSGFSGLPGGAKATVGHFYDVGYSGNWWSSSNSDDANAWYRDLELTNPEQVYRASTNRNHGFSIRCVKDTE